jgi:hypothetical protein
MSKVSEVPRMMGWVILVLTTISSLFFIMSVRTAPLPQIRLAAQASLQVGLYLAGIALIIRAKRKRLADVLTPISGILAVSSLIMWLWISSS